MTPATRDGAANAIAIGPDDSLLDVFDRVRAAGQTPVELLIPNESPLFLTAAEFRTLRDVTDHGRHEVTIRTSDPHRLQLAKLFGLEIARTPGPVPPSPVPKPSPPPKAADTRAPETDGASTTAITSTTAPMAKPTNANEPEPDKAPAASKQTSAPAPGARSGTAGSGDAHNDDVESSVSEQEAAARWPEPVVHIPTPRGPRRLLDRVSAVVGARRHEQDPVVEPETEPAATGEPGTPPDADSDSESVPADQSDDEAILEDDPTAVTASPRRLTLPGGRPVSPLVLVGAALLVALALFAVLTFLLPSATVRVELASLPINSGIVFDVTTDGQPLDGDAAFALRGEPAEVTVSSSASMPTTGVQTVPDGLATGTIRFANPTPVEVTIEPGTIFTTESGVEFTLAEPVVVPAADPATLVPGEIDAAIEAVAAGTGGNVGTGAIGGRLDTGIFYSNRQAPTQGGTDQEVRVVAQADLDALVAQADAQTIDLVTARVAQDDAAVVAPSLTILDQSDSFDQAVGAEAEQVALEATRTVSILTYDQAEASRVIADELGGQLQAMVPPGFRLGPVAIGADDVSPLDGTAEGGRFQVDAEARAALALTPEKEAELASALASKSPEEVEAILATWPEVVSYEIEPGFSFLTSNLPANSGRIEVDDGS